MLLYYMYNKLTGYGEDKKIIVPIVKKIFPTTKYRKIMSKKGGGVCPKLAIVKIVI